MLASMFRFTRFSIFRLLICVREFILPGTFMRSPRKLRRLRGE